MRLRWGVSFVKGAQTHASYWRAFGGGMRPENSSNARSLRPTSRASRHREPGLERFLSESSGDQVVAARMLVFQSKLLLMNTANRRFRRTKAKRDLKQVEHLRAELHQAEAALRTTEVEGHLWSSPDFWLAVYASLVERATDALDRMTIASYGRPAAERFESATDIQMLEELIAQWTSRMRAIQQAAFPDGAAREDV